MRPTYLILLAAVCAALVATPFPADAQPKGKRGVVPPGTSVYRDLAYGNHERNKLDLAVPPGAGPFPLVLWVHGGGWTGGSKNDPPIVGLLNYGYAVASTNYRLSQHAVFPAQIHDVKAAVRFLRANARKYRLDTDRFGAAGGSAGGHLVALLGTSGGAKDLEGQGHAGVSSSVQAVCDIYGPADLTAGLGADDADDRIVRLLGGQPKDKLELARLASPVSHIDAKDPPFLIIHGTNDSTVPIVQSRRFDTALRKAGVKSELIEVKGVGHDLKKILTPDVRARAIAFFDKHLKK